MDASLRSLGVNQIMQNSKQRATKLFRVIFSRVQLQVGDSFWIAFLNRSGIKGQNHQIARIENWPKLEIIRVFPSSIQNS